MIQLRFLTKILRKKLMYSDEKVTHSVQISSPRDVRFYKFTVSFHRSFTSKYKYIDDTRYPMNKLVDATASNCSSNYKKEYRIHAKRHKPPPGQNVDA